MARGHEACSEPGDIVQTEVQGHLKIWKSSKLVSLNIACLPSQDSAERPVLATLPLTWCVSWVSCWGRKTSLKFQARRKQDKPSKLLGNNDMAILVEVVSVLVTVVDVFSWHLSDLKYMQSLTVEDALKIKKKGHVPLGQFPNSCNVSKRLKHRS